MDLFFLKRFGNERTADLFIYFIYHHNGAMTNRMNKLFISYLEPCFNYLRIDR